MGFIEFICELVQDYAKEYNLDEKDVFFMFSENKVFERISDEYLEYIKDDNPIIRIHDYLNK